jgi:hypothetical protein
MYADFAVILSVSPKFSGFPVHIDTSTYSYPDQPRTGADPGIKSRAAPAPWVAAPPYKIAAGDPVPQTTGVTNLDFVATAG